ncbi:T9SS type A sorting domain-containing protein [Dyadobacter sp. Leaf189]|uniref:T9SS type A sorting domain-containing protein n=1 Tax=Dyadobacter sp. Leaf189 TaxID=1736295 RepID=UPI0009E83704|nr:T9SS type A sorting domain-containing protein [Dyadobacter sp. Leaf189]
MKQTSLSNSLFKIQKKVAVLFWILLLVQCQSLYAQLRIVPIDPSNNTDIRRGSEENNLRTEAVTLPFFDDFSTARTASPDIKYWLPGSGVYINNSLSTSHPSRNLATFDGLNAAGIPYNLNNQLGQGFTDTLTSQAINLAGKTAADSVYLSFYWSAKGFGELPDSSDFLSLEYFNRNNQWVTVWQQNGFEADTTFKQQFVAITNAAYLHAVFQFRFRSFGRNSGAYDTWHLDYVHLDAKRSRKQPYIFDVATRKAISPLLKRYTAMPLRQYLVNPAGALSDSIKTDIVNHFNNFNVLTSTFTLTDVKSGKEFQRNVQRSIFVESLKSKTLSVKPAPAAISAPGDSIHLLAKFFITTTDTIPNVNLKNNDTITSRISLTDYYAFDDGSAEYGIQVNQRLGRVAVRYILAKPDTIGGVRMAIVPFNRDVAGQNFTIQFLSSKNGKPDRVLAQRSAAASYASDRNGFADYRLSTPVAVPDTFYVGWQQINEQPLTVGFDRNSTLGKDHVFYNLGTEWAKEQSLNGSIMIRPYLGAKVLGVVTGREEVATENWFYPNPSNGTISWKAKNLNQIYIYSNDGKLLDTILPKRDQQSQELRGLKDGIYILKASDGKRSFVQKMLILK